MQARMAEACCTERDKRDFEFNIYAEVSGKKQTEPENDDKDADAQTELKTASLKENWSGRGRSPSLGQKPGARGHRSKCKYNYINRFQTNI